jgi:hypothetical protein
MKVTHSMGSFLDVIPVHRQRLRIALSTACGDALNLLMSKWLAGFALWHVF